MSDRSPIASPHARSSWSTSRPRAGTRRRSASTCSRSCRRRSTEFFAGDDAFLLASRRRPDAPLVVLAGHYDTVPAQEQPPGPDRGRRGARARRRDMKGGVAVALELVRDLAGTRPRPVDVALLLFGREELPPRSDPLPALFERCAARPRGRSRGPARADRPDDPGRLPRQPQRAGHLPRRQRPLGAAVAGRERDPPGARGPRPGRGARAARGADRGPAVLRGRLRHADRGGHRRQRRPGSRRRDRSTSATRPTARPSDAEALLRSLVPTDATVEVIGNSPPGAVAVGRAARAGAPRRRATSRSSRSRRGRTSPTSRRAGSTPSTSAPARRATRTAATSRSRSTRSSVLRDAAPLSRSAIDCPRVPLSPILRAKATYPFVRLNEAAASAAREGSRSSTSAWATRASRPTRDPAGAPRRRARAHGLSGRCRPARAARGDRRLGRAPLRRRARPRHPVDPDARLEGGDLLLRPGRPRRPPPDATPSS